MIWKIHETDWYANTLQMQSFILRSFGKYDLIMQSYLMANMTNFDIVDSRY